LKPHEEYGHWLKKDDLRTRKTKCFLIYFLVSAFCLTGITWPAQSISAKEKQMSSSVHNLPAPETERTQLMKTLKLRSTKRNFGTKELPSQMLSNLLWAAYGVNRKEQGKRTAPSAHDRQQIDIYVADNKGVRLYDAKKNTLKKILNKDIRAMTGMQGYPKHAPISLIYVMDAGKMGNGQAEQTNIYFSYVTAGAIVQNVYLFCAAEGLNAAVRGDIKQKELHGKMGLRNNQKILLAQSVGYPKAGFKKWIKKILNK